LNAALAIALSWYVVHTKAAAETLAQANLERQGYVVYLPRLAQSVLWRRQRRERIVPLFPRYLFLRLKEGCQPFAPVRSSIGVSGVVRFGSRYAVVADAVLARLRAREDALTGLHRLAEPAPLTSGAAVLIAAGPFDGLEGIFQREDGAERVIVLLKLLGQDTPVRVPAGWVLPRSDAAMRPRAVAALGSG
jgi:transcriptional antiterminator RfaH